MQHSQANMNEKDASEKAESQRKESRIETNRDPSDLDKKLIFENIKALLPNSEARVQAIQVIIILLILCISFYNFLSYSVANKTLWFTRFSLVSVK